jgi:hypothetical protein
VGEPEADSLDPDEPINQLSASEFRLLCERYVDRVFSGIGSDEDLCQRLALDDASGSSEAELFSSCYLATDQCLYEQKVRVAELWQANLDKCASNPVETTDWIHLLSDCGEPARRLSACLDAAATAWLAPLDTSCEDLTPELQLALRTPAAPKLCAALEEDCSLPVLDEPGVEFVIGCDYDYSGGKHECLEVYCEDCSDPGIAAVSSCPLSTDLDGTVLYPTERSSGCVNRNTSVGGCHKSGGLAGEGTAHLVLFVWPTDGSSEQKYQDECEAGGNTYLPP